MSTLEPVMSDRGFKHFEPVPCTPGYEVKSVCVYESSAALQPCLWLGLHQFTPAHLTLENAAKLRDQLTYLIEHHYQIEQPSEDSK